MNGEIKHPCRECIVKMICTSQISCNRLRNYTHLMVQREKDKRDLAFAKNQATVDGYFKRFRRSR